MIEPKDDVKELRKFAVTLFSAVGVLGAFFIWQERDMGFVLWGIGSVALLAAWVCPMGIKARVCLLDEIGFGPGFYFKPCDLGIGILSCAYTDWACYADVREESNAVAA